MRQKSKPFLQRKKLPDNIPFLVNLAGAVCLKELLKDGTLPLCPWMGERDESPRVNPQPRWSVRRRKTNRPHRQLLARAPTPGLGSCGGEAPS